MRASDDDGLGSVRSALGFRAGKTQQRLMAAEKARRIGTPGRVQKDPLDALLNPFEGVVYKAIEAMKDDTLGGRRYARIVQVLAQCFVNTFVATAIYANTLGSSGGATALKEPFQAWVNTLLGRAALPLPLEEGRVFWAVAAAQAVAVAALKASADRRVKEA